jgi:hypothetical protein
MKAAELANLQRELSIDAADVFFLDLSRADLKEARQTRLQK